MVFSAQKWGSAVASSGAPQWGSAMGLSNGVQQYDNIIRGSEMGQRLTLSLVLIPPVWNTQVSVAYKLAL